MKKFFFVLIIIFICGVLSADICLKQIQESEVFVSLELYEQYATSKIVFKDIFWNVFYERAKLFIGILLLCFTPLKEYLGIILAPIFSFIWGFFLMSCIVELGVAGLVVGLASVLPHGILYGGSIWFLLGGIRKQRYHVKNQTATNLGRYIFVLLLFVTACVIESLVGTHFIPWVIRLSLV